MLAFLANAALYVVPFLVIITFIVTIHELGHFLVARACGIAVDRFSIGFGKTIFAVKDRWGVEWRVAWLPLGGYVKFAGDDNVASVPDDDDLESLRARIIEREGLGAEKRYFAFKPLWQRALVVLAGPAANFVLSIALFAILFCAIGQQVVWGPIQKISPGSAAFAAGLRPGDQLVSADGRQLGSIEQLKEYVFARNGVPIDFALRRAGALIHLTVTPTLQILADSPGGDEKGGQLGVSIQPLVQKIVRYDPISAIGMGVDRTWRTTETTVFVIGRIVGGGINPNALHGVIGTAGVSGQLAKEAINEAPGDPATQALGVLINMVSLCAALSVSVGLVNLLPIPILDGGHLLFYAYEWVVRRPLSAGIQAAGYRVGLALLVCLMLFANVNDLHLQKVFHFFGALFS
jgi:regulator of sigma E protease